MGFHRFTIVGRTDRFSVTHDGVTPGALYYYTVFVQDGANVSAGTTILGRPIEPGPLRWRFTSGMTGMSPPGIGVSVLAPSNDAVYAMKRGALGGTWPAGFEPYPTPLPVQHRPPVIASGAIPGDDNFSLVTSQDGIVRAIDPETGREIWESPDVGMAQAAPAAWLEDYGAPTNLYFFGSRNAGEDNLLHGKKLVDGGDEWTYQNDDGGVGLGIIPGSVTVDYQRDRVYFACNEKQTGANTVFALTAENAELVWRRPMEVCRRARC